MSQNQVAMAGTKPLDVPNDFVKMHSVPNNNNFQGLGYNLQIPGLAGNTSKPEVMGSLLKFMGPPFLLEAQKNFDFWTEEENIRFVNAIESVKFPPDFSIVSARLGNKTPEQCSCYASFYYSALQHHRNKAEANGQSASFHIKAADVYAYLGVSPAYTEFLRNHKPNGASAQSPPASDPLSPSMRAAAGSPPSSLNRNAAAATHNKSSNGSNGGSCSSSSSSSTTAANSSASSSSSENVTKDAAPSSKSSIDFLCGGGEDEVKEVVQPKTEASDDVSGVAANGVESSEMRDDVAGVKTEDEETKDDEEKQEAREESGGAEAAVARNRVKRIGAGQNPNGKGSEIYDEDSPLPPPKKKFRAASPPKEKERDIDRNRIPAKDMWEYACMQEGHVVKEEEMEFEKKEHNGGKNPWDWTRRMIVKPNGYANWWPLFAEYVQLSRRDVSDDMRSIRDKTPGGNTVANRNGDEERDERPAPKKGGKQKKEQLHEWVRVGCFVEVKWEGDWWHAKVKKLKHERGSEKLEKVFVSYVGGTEDEDEWVPAQASRLRAPREDVSEQAESKPASKKAKGGKRR